MTRSNIQVGHYDDETGWMLTDDEAYTLEEWESESIQCVLCPNQFVVEDMVDEDGLPVRGGRPSKYCSTVCAEEAHREQSRQHMKARRMAAASG